MRSEISRPGRAAGRLPRRDRNCGRGLRHLLGQHHAHRIRGCCTRSRSPLASLPFVAMAAETVSANDITLDLYDPSGNLKVHGDSATSPETVDYQSPDLQTGYRNVQVCPFAGGVVARPTATPAPSRPATRR